MIHVADNSDLIKMLLFITLVDLSFQNLRLLKRFATYYTQEELMTLHERFFSDSIICMYLFLTKHCSIYTAYQKGKRKPERPLEL